MISFSLSLPHHSQPYSAVGLTIAVYILTFMCCDIYLAFTILWECLIISIPCCYSWGTRWRSWLRHCATSRKVAGSIPNGVTGIFYLHNPAALWPWGLTQPLTEISTRNVSWGGGVKAAGVWGWQPYHLHVLIVLKLRSVNLLELSGPVQACNGIALHFCCYSCSHIFSTIIIVDPNMQ